MEVIVVKRFRDKFDGRTRYMPGEVVKFEAERAQDLIERGLAVAAHPVTAVVDDIKAAGNFKDGPVGAEREPGPVGELMDDANGDDAKGDDTEGGNAKGDDTEGGDIKEDKPDKGEVKQEQTANKPKTKKG